MTLWLVLLAVLFLTGMWMAIIFLIPDRLRYFLARCPIIFLAIHVPVMLLMANIGGEGLVMGLANLGGGLLAQVYLAWWGVRKHGLTWLGRRSPRWHDLHPKKEKERVIASTRKSISDSFDMMW